MTFRLSAGCAGLALLSACAASPGSVAEGPSTDYYISHAAGNYTPPGPPGDPWGPYINIASRRFDVPAQWVRQVMRVESGGQEYMDGQLTVSPAGAMGLMQLEPATYQEMAARYGLGSDPFNPYDNIMAGTAYIHEMYEVYGSPGFLAAYNAGPGRLDSYVDYHTPLPHETTRYVAMIAPQIEGYYPVHRSEADQLALNTMPATSAMGILPAGFDPDRAPPEAPSNPIAPVQVAMLTPAPAAESSVYAPQPALVQPVPPAPPPPQPTPHFSLIPSAMADTPPPQAQIQPVAPGHTGWAVQMGAYSTSSKANAAIGIAELSAVQMLMHGQPVVVSVHSGGVTRYRARVIGLPHDEAVQACERLATSPTGCVVLSPDAQG
jgi:hypothetical protein